MIKKEAYLNKLNTEFKHPYIILKRIFDVVLSILALVPVSIVVFLFAVIIIVDSKGGPFYSQERVGLMGKRFKVIKLRSMRNDAEANGAQWAEEEDPRITRVGKVMRKTRIDELPQLFNVLVGQMSLIGPRPERPNFTQQFSDEIEGFEQRLLIKPGLSGYAQVNGGYDISPAEKLKLDLFYMEHFSLRLDFSIFIRTITVVLTGDGAR
ncbi:sugar transferase [Dellaglioa algida]|uniref:Priming glycosyltransferase n=1 Tax=Dellaglioa algida DSM 15638 TaxID=1423719 RepID=A0A0R1HG98_9LACO|nr:sugar transferase [Dellaglioa algida]KRK45517.1 priming glycosyltransferase [Dellaglioa algida DSM 15638]MDK1732052.1 sugar transferase [Dellaglioa algida]MDK1733578.1 sugar transferase [Dellaglioa algida]